MLEIRRTAIALEGQELVMLERIVTDGDEKEALKFLKKSIYARVVQSQRGCEVLYGGKVKEICLANSK